MKTISKDEDGKMMKPPLTYYGGKQRLSQRIISIIPKHNLYCEPFFGGGAVFFTKEPSPVEIINDTNGELINFYKVVKTNFRKLENEIRSTLHSRKSHYQANVVLNNPELFDEVKRAWAVWTSANQSFGSILGSTWRCDFTGNSSSKRLHNKRNAFTQEYTQRLAKTQIECRDALYVISSMDKADSFFYCDPPYYNSHMGHYKGYMEKDFEALLDLLAKIKGKFLLSSYPSKLLKGYIQKNKWHTHEIDMSVAVSAQANTGKRKTEVLTANYEI